jgi:ABC-type lipoprotein release transport system permease subunit
MIWKLIQIAFRNVMKHKRRSSFNMLTFAVNMMALVAMIGLLRGQYNVMLDRNIDLVTGHLKIYNSRYTAEKRRFPLDLNIAAPKSVIADISGAPGFVKASARIVKDGILSDSRDKTGIIIYGIDMAGEKKITTIFDKYKDKELSPGQPGILVGKRLAELMGIGSGAPLLLFSQTINKANNLVDLSAYGIYSAGFEFMERNTVYIDYDFAQRFFDTGGAATEIIVRLKDRSFVPAAKAYVKKVLADKYPGLIVNDWLDESPELISAVEQDFVTYAIIFFILLFLAVFIIINTLTIGVFERIPEIGTLRALGFQASQVRTMFFIEGIVLTFFGIILGGILVLPLVYYMNVHGILIRAGDLSGIEIPFNPVIRSANSLADWFIAGAVCLGAGMTGAIFPSRRASKIKIVDALKKGAR